MTAEGAVLIPHATCGLVVKENVGFITPDVGLRPRPGPRSEIVSFYARITEVKIGNEASPLAAPSSKVGELAIATRSRIRHHSPRTRSWCASEAGGRSRSGERTGCGGRAGEGGGRWAGEEKFE